MRHLVLWVNDKRESLEVDEQTPLLWVLRDALGLTGTKFGCGMALCGACTVHVDGRVVRSCVTPIGSVAGKKVRTIEGLALEGGKRLQEAWIAEAVPQCGYCQSGMLMAAAELLARKPEPSDADLDSAFAGHVCRCGTYQRIRLAVQRAAGHPRPPAGSAPEKSSRERP